MEFQTVFYRSILFYIIVSIVYRIMGKREIGELSIMDFTVSIFIAEFVAISIENYKSNIFLTIIPIITLTLIQIIVSHISMKNNKTRKTIDGIPSVIINRGRINFEEMKKQRYNLDDLLTELRQKEVKSIEEVDYAILEINGKLSVFKKNNDKSYPLPLIIDGELDKNVLRQIRRKEKWLNEELARKNTSINNIFYCFYKDNNLYIIDKDKIN